MKKNQDRKLIANLSRLYRRQFHTARQNLAMYEAEKLSSPLSEQLWNLRNL